MREVFIVIERVYRHRHTREQTVSLLVLFVSQNMLTLHRSVFIMFLRETFYTFSTTARQSVRSEIFPTLSSIPNRAVICSLDETDDEIDVDVMGGLTS